MSAPEERATATRSWVRALGEPGELFLNAVAVGHRSPRNPRRRSAGALRASPGKLYALCRQVRWEEFMDAEREHGPTIDELPPPEVEEIEDEWAALSCGCTGDFL